MGASSRDRLAIGLWLLAILNLANGLWMIGDPSRWFTDLPAAVPDFGPYNEHFVRDVGAAFVAMAAALALAARRPAARLPLVGVVAVFYGLHAAAHVYDTVRGAVDPHHWWTDLPGVYLPAVLFAVLVLWLARAPVAATRPDGS
jgi:hypothetical protein